MGGAGNIEWLIMRRSALTRDVMLKVGAVDETLVSGFTRSWYKFPHRGQDLVGPLRPDDQLWESSHGDVPPVIHVHPVPNEAWPNSYSFV